MGGVTVTLCWKTPSWCEDPRRSASQLPLWGNETASEAVFMKAVSVNSRTVKPQDLLPGGPHKRGWVSRGKGSPQSQVMSQQETRQGSSTIYF